jgi:type I site-specific restriction endonuclease
VVLTGQRRALLTLCTGAGKTAVAFQIAWRLWTAGWNKRGDFRKPKILFLADRNILVDDPMAKTFAPFGDALPTSPSDFGKFIADETEKWGKVFKLSGAKPN